MRRGIAVLCLLGGALAAVAQETVPAGITCCDEEKIRQAMTEEALARIATLAEPGGSSDRRAADYLSQQAFARIGKYLPAGSREQRLAYLREALHRLAPDADIREFQELVGNFVLGMTLEIGYTLQDEYDQARLEREKADKLLVELQKTPVAAGEVPAQALFSAGISRKELRRIRALARRRPELPANAAPFDEFDFLKRIVCGARADPDQTLVFELAEAYRPRFPFLDEFLKNYRLLAGEFRESARQINEILAFSER
jgi:hypothetical protein